MDLEKQFHVYTPDASDRQLGATTLVIQDGKPFGFYTWKLNQAQKNYAAWGRILLGKVERLEASEGRLSGQYGNIHTDHLNLLNNKCPGQRILRWRLILEAFYPRVPHMAGKDNDAADALSRRDMVNIEDDEVEWKPEFLDSIWMMSQVVQL